MKTANILTMGSIEEEKENIESPGFVASTVRREASFLASKGMACMKNSRFYFDLNV